MTKILFMLITQHIGIFLFVITFFVFMRSNLVMLQMITVVMSLLMSIALFYTYCLYFNVKSIITKNKRDEENQQKQKRKVSAYQQKKQQQKSPENKEYNESIMI